MDRKLFKVLAREEEEEEDNGVKIMLFRFNMYMYIHDEIDSYLHAHCRIEDIDIEINLKSTQFTPMIQTHQSTCQLLWHNCSNFSSYCACIFVSGKCVFQGIEPSDSV